MVCGMEASPFPERIEDAPGGPRVVQTFGFGPAFLALILACYPLYIVQNAARVTFGAAEYATIATLLAGAAVSLAYERGRRKRRATLVFSESHVGVYRKGILHGSLTRSELLACMQRTPYASIKGLAAVGFLSMAFVVHGARQTEDALSLLVGLAPGIALAGLTLSLLRTTWLCRGLDLAGARGASLFSLFELRSAGAWQAQALS